MNSLVSWDLHNADEAMHAQANAIMERSGFIRTFQSGNGATVYLPATTVAGVRNDSAADLCNGVWKAFDSSGLNPKRVVVNVDGTVHAISRA